MTLGSFFFVEPDGLLFEFKSFFMFFGFKPVRPSASAQPQTAKNGVISVLGCKGLKTF